MRTTPLHGGPQKKELSLLGTAVGSDYALNRVCIRTVSLPLSRSPSLLRLAAIAATAVLWTQSRTQGFPVAGRRGALECTPMHQVQACSGVRPYHLLTVNSAVRTTWTPFCLSPGGATSKASKAPKRMQAFNSGRAACSRRGHVASASCLAMFMVGIFPGGAPPWSAIPSQAEVYHACPGLDP